MQEPFRIVSFLWDGEEQTESISDHKRNSEDLLVLTNKALYSLEFAKKMEMLSSYTKAKKKEKK